MKYIIGRKIEMKQQYADNGMVVPFTLVQAGPCIVTQVKTAKKDGYDAIQLGYGEKKKASRPLQGHLRGLSGVKEGRSFAALKEMRLSKPAQGVERGDRADVTSFSVGDSVDVTGQSKGRGFAGVVKRHHFHGHPTTHGHKDQERMPGSIGSGGVQHVFKGQRMAGRMGGEQVTVKKLTVVSVDPENNILAIQGAIPGWRNGFVVIVAHDGDMQFSKSVPENNEKEPEAPSIVADGKLEAPISEPETPTNTEQSSEPVEQIAEQTPEEKPSEATLSSDEEQK